MSFSLVRRSWTLTEMIDRQQRLLGETRSTCTVVFRRDEVVAFDLELLFVDDEILSHAFHDPAKGENEAVLSNGEHDGFGQCADQRIVLADFVGDQVCDGVIECARRVQEEETAVEEDDEFLHLFLKTSERERDGVESEKENGGQTICERVRPLAARTIVSG